MAIITGTRRNDDLDGTALDDVISGEDGNDVLRGLAGADALFGGEGNDLLDGGDDDDRLDGGEGNDELAGGLGRDRLVGGAGNDRHDGGAGTDVAVFGGDASGYEIKTVGGVTFVKDRNAADGDDGHDKLVGVERLQFADQIVFLTPNQVPAALDDAAATDEDTALVLSAAALLGNDSDGDGDPLRITAVTDGSHGTAVLSADGSSIVYTPNAGFHGTDTITYTVSDGFGGVATATVTVTVSPVEAGPALARVSVASDGTQADGPSYTGFGPYITFSADGRYLAFYSDASNLVAGDTNGQGDFFILDRATGTLERVPANNIYGGGGPILSSISADGRYLAFGSYADDLVPGDTNGRGDIFVYDRITDTTQRIQANLTPGFDAASPVLSADGNFVAFSSFASDLVAGDTNGAADVFIYNRATGTTERMLAGGAEPNHSSQPTSISADGRFVALFSAASNLVAGDTNGVQDVFVFDRQLNQIERVSVAGDGTQGNVDSAQPSISADGRYVAFNSSASNLVADDTNGQADVFVYDRLTDTIERVSVASDGAQAVGGESAGASISADGRYVAYYSLASNLVAGDTNGNYDAFVFDRLAHTTTRVSVAEDGTQGNGMSVRSVISPDGQLVAFDSLASNLVVGDSNGVSDVFVSDWQLI